MTTVVNNPAPQAPTQDTGGFGFLIGIIVLIGFVAVLLYFAIPAIRNMGAVQVNVPAPQVNVPSKIDVNVTQPK
ncbi:MAG: hypothetical protein V1858_05085 [Candidatus Gottesmanbacteria bacterium]